MNYYYVLLMLFQKTQLKQIQDGMMIGSLGLIEARLIQIETHTT